MLPVTGRDLLQRYAFGPSPGASRHPAECVSYPATSPSAVPRVCLVQRNGRESAKPYFDLWLIS